MLYKNILVAVDDSEYARKAVEQAVELSALMDSRVTLVHVVVPLNPVAHYERLLPMYPEIGEVYDDIGKTILQESAARFPEEREVSTLLVHGNPAAEILELAKDGYDLLVMGSHGSGGRLFTMGSVVSRVVNHTELPVLVVR